MSATDLIAIHAPGRDRVNGLCVTISTASLAAIVVLPYYSDSFNAISLDLLLFSLLVVAAALVLPVFFYRWIKERKVIRLSLFDLLVALLALDMFLSGLLHGASRFVYTSPLIYLIFYFITRCQIVTSRAAEQANRAIYWGLVLYLAFLAVLWAKSGNLKTVVIGSFSNPNVNAGLLCIFLPVAAGQLKPRKWFDLNSLLAIVALLVTTSIVIFSDSRTAWLATGAMGCQYLFWHTGLLTLIRRNLLTSFVILFAGFVFLAVTLYYFKPASLEGRYLIYKVSAEMFFRNPVVGIGYGKYHAQYNNFQSEYLAAKPDEPLKFLADNNYSPFNEVLGIAVELGAIGLALVMLLFLCLLIPMIKFSRANHKLPVASYLLIAVLVCALFNYPFSTTSVNILTILTAVQLKWYIRDYCPEVEFNLSSRFGSSLSGTLISLAALIYGYLLVQAHRASDSWRQAMAFSLLDEREHAKAAYQTAKIWLHNDGRFLYNYGAELSVWGNYEESILILNQARKYYTSSSLYTYLGDGYYRTSQYKLAGNAYRKAANMVPSKLYPKYKLLKLYQSTNQKKAAQEVAFEITTTPVKVPSRLTSEIRAEAKKVLDSLGTGSLMR